MITQGFKIAGQMLMAGAAVLALGCSSTPSKPAGYASAGCAQLGDATQAAAPQMNQVYASREVRDQSVYGDAYDHVIQKDLTASTAQTQRVMGADLYMHASPGVTAEYVQRALTCHAASGQPLSNNDPFHPAEGHVASVDVRNAGSGFAVRVLGSDAAAGKDIWRRAEAMTGGGADVNVEQVAEATTSSAF